MTHRILTSIVRCGRVLNPFAWLALFVSVGVFVAMNVASYERYETDQVWLSVGWPLQFWTKMQGTFLVVSHTRYEYLAANVATLGIVATAYVVLAQSYVVQFSIRAILGLTFFVALVLSIGSAFANWETTAVVLYVSPVFLLFVLVLARRAWLDTRGRMAP